MRFEKENKWDVESQKILDRKRRSMAKKLNLEEDSDIETVIDAIVASEDFKRYALGQPASCEKKQDAEDTEYEMLGDMIALTCMVKHVELLLSLEITGKICPLYSMSEAGRIVDQAEAVLAKWSDRLHSDT